MAEQDKTTQSAGPSSFYERPGVKTETIPVGTGVPMGMETVRHEALGIGGAYGTWGQSIDNEHLPEFVETTLHEPLEANERLNLSPLGFRSRHHVSGLSKEQHLELEVAVGARFLEEAMQVNNWQPNEVDGVLIGVSGPVADDYTERISERAGISQDAIKVSLHKACDSSMGGLHMVLNPELDVHKQLGRNLAEELSGKKVLVGGIEGLSRFIQHSRDKTALQLFGNGAGVIGLVPGETMKFIVGQAHESFDENGVLGVSMFYPYKGERVKHENMLEATKAGENYIRVAGLMNEPESGESISMAGPMGMVKLFVRTGVDVVRDVYQMYQRRMVELGQASRNISQVVVHHANYKINSLKVKNLQKLGINLDFPWVLSEFGNVSAASNMIAFLRQLPSMNVGDHIMFDGFGAGTYYDVFAVSLGENSA
ncbi:MAG: hypothetical protein DWQ07_04095 [Chloroflexi bacterium]|nr:MAG: hypothetical protein DWQ07_04095 [Chloroflexota bacterium]MBL1193316.1 hypothetical protein [Chloroflexota bacterium]NOH10608.1 hypothetical protein [Chloroflexota bacterium]